MRNSILGGEGQAVSVSNNRRLIVTGDYDVNANSLNSGSHLGLEFWPTGNLALRGGLDGKDPTAGIGVRAGGFEFDYAYHPLMAL